MWRGFMNDLIQKVAKKWKHAKGDFVVFHRLGKASIKVYSEALQPGHHYFGEQTFSRTFLWTKEKS